MLRRRFRSGTAWTMAALVSLLPSLQACYEYVPITTSAPKVGEQVTFEITDQGRVSLADRFGAGLAEIQGRVVSTQGDEYVLNVFRVSHVGGQSSMWSGETTRLQRSFLGAAKGRVFSRSRTALVAGSAAVVVGYLIFSGRLNGTFNGSTDEPTPIGPASIRIPLGSRP